MRSVWFQYAHPYRPNYDEEYSLLECKTRNQSKVLSAYILRSRHGFDIPTRLELDIIAYSMQNA